MSPDASRCQSTRGDVPPWAGDQRAEDKTRLFREVASTPYSQTLTGVLKAALGTTARDSSYDADRKLAERLFRDSPLFHFDRPEYTVPIKRDGMYETATRQDEYFVERTPRAVSLYRSMEVARNADGDGVKESAAKAEAREILNDLESIPVECPVCGVTGEHAVSIYWPRSSARCLRPQSVRQSTEVTCDERA